MMTCVPFILNIKEDLSLYGAIVEVKREKVKVSVGKQPNVSGMRQAQDARIRRMKWKMFTRT